MLVLSRERGETVNIGDEIEVTVIDIRGDKVRLGVSAPRHVSVHRKEVYEAIKRQQKEASSSSPSSSTGSSDQHPGADAADVSDGTPDVQTTPPDQPTSIKAPPSAPPAA